MRIFMEMFRRMARMNADRRLTSRETNRRARIVTAKDTDSQNPVIYRFARFSSFFFFFFCSNLFYSRLKERTFTRSPLDRATKRWFPHGPPWKLEVGSESRVGNIARSGILNAVDFSTKFRNSIGSPRGFQLGRNECWIRCRVSVLKWLHLRLIGSAV